MGLALLSTSSFAQCGNTQVYPTGVTVSGGCGYTQVYSSVTTTVKSGGCGYTQVYPTGVAASGGCGQAAIYSTGIAAALKSRPVPVALSAALKQIRSNRNQRAAERAAAATAVQVQVNSCPCPSCPATEAAIPAPTATSSLQAEAQWEAQTMAARGFKGHVRGCIAGVRFCGVGWASHAKPSTCTPRRAMQLVADAIVRGSDGYYRVRYWA